MTGRPRSEVPGPGASARWWWWPSAALGGLDPFGLRPVLFFPPSGAEPSVAQVLVPHASGLRLGVLQLPGRGDRVSERPPSDLDALIGEIAAAVLRVPGPAPMLVGHSFGGLLAYGVTARLEALGAGPGRLVVVAANAPGRWSAELAADPDRSDPEVFGERRASAIVAHGGVPEALRGHPELAARARELTRIDVELSRAGFPVTPVRTPLTVIAAREDQVLSWGACDGWAEVAAGGLRRIDVGGDHFFYRAAPERLMAHLRLDLYALDEL